MPIELVQQWLDLHGLPAAPMSQSVVDGHPRQVWWNADGETVVESYTIADMAHGTPLGIGENDERFGAQGAFLLEVGISSSYHIAKFFGLTGRIHLSRAGGQNDGPCARRRGRFRRAHAGRLPRRRDAAPGQARLRRLHRRQRGDHQALTAAGLMK